MNSFRFINLLLENWPNLQRAGQADKYLSLLDTRKLSWRRKFYLQVLIAGESYGYQEINNSCIYGLKSP